MSIMYLRPWTEISLDLFRVAVLQKSNVAIYCKCSKFSYKANLFQIMNYNRRCYLDGFPSYQLIAFL